jgi:retron-type reverse transcriptase
MKKKGNLTLDPLGMNNLMFDYCLKSDSFLTRLVSIFNSCIQNKYFPDFLKTAKVVPIPKVPNPKSPAELRPISIQPVVAKLFEKCLFFQLSRHLEMNHIICPTQYGFRSKHSTFHALINITDFIYECLDKNEVCMLVTLDIRKAFDRVDHEVIFRKLHSYNIDPTFFMSYLSNRSHFVSVEE